jgi:hypothetical protein
MIRDPVPVREPEPVPSAPTPANSGLTRGFTPALNRGSGGSFFAKPAYLS